MKKRNIISFIISSAMLLLTVSVPAVSADDEPSYSTIITFGDSIAVSSADHKSFASLAGEYIMASQGADCTLFNSENGKTSDEILNSIKNDESLISPKEIYGNEYDGDYNELYVFISAGGNDYLDFFEEAVDPYLEEGDSLISLTPEKTENLKNRINDDRDNFLQKLNSSDEIAEKALSNISEMASYIKSVQPEAEIYVLEIYNPFDRLSESGDETMLLISRVADSILKKFNSSLSENELIHTVPAFDAIKEHPSDFIIENDIHPTLAGHIRIAELILNDITKEDNTAILRNMKNGQNNFAPLLSLSEYDSLPEYMKEGIETETPEVTTAVSVTETPQITSSVTSAASSSVTSASVSVSAVSSSPKTSDRGISAVTVAGLFTAAAACLMLRRKENK